MILQMAAGLILSFVLLDALKAGYPSFLETAAASGTLIRAGVASGIVGAALTVCLAAGMFPRFAVYSRPLAMAFAAACVISAALDLVHNATVLSMLSAGEHYTAAGGSSGANAALYNAWGIAAGSLRRSAHIMQLFAIGAWIFTFYFLLFRSRLVPRPLAILGILGIICQFTGVTLMMFLGSSPIGYLAMPLAPIHVLTAAWIIVKGFRSDPAESSLNPTGQ